MQINRNRLLYLFLILLVMILGISSRKLANFIPDIINLYFGDALWALMIFLIMGFLFRKLSIARIAFISIVFCYCIELSQLYHTNWIDAIRNTTLGGLVLGFGFLWSDVLAYSMGVLMGSLLEWQMLNLFTGSRQKL